MNIKILLTIIIINITSIAQAQIRVVSGGAVGIGQTVPTAKLDIVNTNSGNLFRIGMESITTNLPSLFFYQTSNAATPGLRTSMCFEKGAFEIYDQTARASRLWISPTTGNIGINTQTGPSNFKFSIQAGSGAALATYEGQPSVDYGYAHISYVKNSTVKNWAVYLNGVEKFYVAGGGNVYAYGVYLTSDARLKTNIKDLSGSDRLYSLRAKSYNFVSDNKNISTLNSDNVYSEYGFLAQDVQKIFPELVQTDNSGSLSLNYIALIPIIVESLQKEHDIALLRQAKVEELSTLVSEQKKVIQCLEEKMNTACYLANAEVIKNAILEQNAPNPFQQKTEIKCYIPLNSSVASVYIYDLQGQQILKMPINEKGSVITVIDGNKLKAGMYIYNLIIDGKEIDSKRMILID